MSRESAHCRKLAVDREDTYGPSLQPSHTPTLAYVVLRRGNLTRKLLHQLPRVNNSSSTAAAEVAMVCVDLERERNHVSSTCQHCSTLFPYSSRFVILSFLPPSLSSASQGPLFSPDTTARAASSATRGGFVTRVRRTSLRMTSTAPWRKAKAGEIPSSSPSAAATAGAATVATAATAKAAAPRGSSPTSAET